MVPHGSLGYLTIWPTGQVQPYMSTMNSPNSRVKANAAIVSAGYEDAVSVYATDTTDVILDIDGYFTAPSSQTYQFFSVAPCPDSRRPSSTVAVGLSGPIGEVVFRT